MPFSVFVSYVYDDALPHAETLVEWGRQGRLGDDVIATMERGDFRPDGRGAIRSEVNSLMNGAGAMVALVGNNSHDRPWIRHEASYMQSARKPVIVVRMPGTTGAAPEGLRGLQEIPFEPGAIAKAIREARGLRW